MEAPVAQHSAAASPPSPFDPVPPKLSTLQETDEVFAPRFEDIQLTINEKHADVDMVADDVKTLTVKAVEAKYVYNVNCSPNNRYLTTFPVRLIKEMIVDYMKHQIKNLSTTNNMKSFM